MSKKLICAICVLVFLIVVSVIISAVLLNNKDGDKNNNICKVFSQMQDKDLAIANDNQIKVKPYKADNNDCIIKQVDVTVQMNKSSIDDFTILNFDGIDVYTTNMAARVSEPIRIETSENIKSATIRFTFNKKNLGKNKLKDLQLMWYNQDTTFYEYRDMKINEANNTITTTTDKLGTFVFVNKAEWEKIWSKDLYSSYAR